ncbi:BRO-N domain-containing protein [Bacillus toyonensis]|uniref:Bro-N domain-containing protein n=1 Tax=Bacillus toyonensis TaxID=155322 RepID=A0A2A8GZM6_9BACI|nr:BRO family protein [Bacillus toyonensis]PEP85174.1 hypothetical protein CN585_30590 [Bacillus toyonensis]
MRQLINQTDKTSIRRDSMSVSIVKSESFGNVVCDVYQNEKNEIFMTRNQIGQALEYTNPNDAIRFIHKRHRERLDQFSVPCKLNGTDGKRYEAVIYNAKGIYEICRWSKQPKADAFYDWVYELLETLRKGEIQITIPKQPKSRKKSANLIFRQEMDIAKTLASMTGVKEGIAYAVAMERAEQKTGEDFSAYKRLLPAATYETGFLNPTKIGEQIGKKSRVVNKLLQERGLQEKLDKEWRLTEEGKKYGEEMPYTRNGHSGYQIKWNERVIDVLYTPEVM